MTPDQRKHFYFPIWQKTATNLDWKMVGGRLLADLDVQLRMAENFPEHAVGLIQNIIAAAQNVAAAERRAATAEDLRHECNRAASRQRTDSSTRFNQRDLNQFDRLCAVLRDPWDLTATIAWLHPEEDDRKRTLVYLRKIANEGRLRAIALNTWATHEVDTLSQAQLDSLTAEIKKGAWSKFPRREKAGQPF